MSDFNKRFKKFEDDFDKDWSRAKKLFWFNTAISLFLLGFIVWVVIMVMKYFGII